MDIILSSSGGKPIYEQITSQIKGMIMSGQLHISVITAQHAYEDLQRDGFIETIPGKGTFVSARNKDFIREEQLRIAEEKLKEAAGIARCNGIPLSQLINILELFYKED